MDNPINNPFLILYEGMAQMQAQIQEIIQIVKKQEIESSERLLSPDECRAMFSPKIGKTTLYRWTKAGLIPKRLVGGKVCYQRSEVMEAAKSIKSYSHKKVPGRNSGRVK